MINRIKGKVVKKQKNFLILDVAGVGYKIFICPYIKEAYEEGAGATLWTELIVREHSMELYGFIKEEELELFKILTSISGVGPKSALSILSLEDVETIKRAASSGDKTYLTKVSGIGKKSAERIIIELRDKFSGDKSENEKTENLRKEDIEVFEALLSLGYKKPQAKDMIKQIPKDTEGTNERLKHALKKPKK